jgi:uncharacterized protein
MKRRSIAVSATGEASVTPDLAVVSLSISAKDRELAAARDDVNRRTSAVLASLRELGVDDADLVAPDISISPEYDYRRDSQKLVGYHIARLVTVRVRALDTLGAILDGSVAAGANELHPVQMTAADPSAAEHEALGAAVSAARAKAQAIADAAQLTLGEVLRVEEEAEYAGPPMPRLHMGAMAESAADVPTEVSAGDLTVTRRVRAWFDVG